MITVRFRYVIGVRGIHHTAHVGQSYNINITFSIGTRGKYVFSAFECSGIIKNKPPTSRPAVIRTRKTVRIFGLDYVHYLGRYRFTPCWRVGLKTFDDVSVLEFNVVFCSKYRYDQPCQMEYPDTEKILSCVVCPSDS